MSLTYQQQHLLDAATGRDAILNLTARYNRCYSDGDRNGWISCFKHSGARFARDGEEFGDLRAAFDGGDGQRLVSVDHDITVDGVNATQLCVAVLYAVDAHGASTLRATGTYCDELVYERGAWYFSSRELRWS